MADGVGLVFPFGDPSHCYRFLTFQFYVHFVIYQSIFSPLTSFVPEAQPNKAAFWSWDHLLKTIFVQDPILRRSSYQLNPTDVAFLNTAQFIFLILEEKLGGGGGAW